MSGPAALCVVKECVQGLSFILSCGVGVFVNSGGWSGWWLLLWCWFFSPLLLLFNFCVFYSLSQFCNNTITLEGDEECSNCNTTVIPYFVFD